MVTHGGFAAAGRALRAPKSTLSRRIAALETRLGVRLIERSTRRFRVTEIGQAFYQRCRIVVMDVEQADAVVSEALGEPRGVVRCSCPLGLVEALSSTFVDFMKAFPKAKLQVVAVDRAVGLIDERIDVAVRVRTALDTDAALTIADFRSLQPDLGRRADPGCFMRRRRGGALRIADARHDRPDGRDRVGILRAGWRVTRDPS